jgi:hypothetical protein
MLSILSTALALTTPAPHPSVDFRNFTYRVHPCMSNVPTAAVMRDGQFAYFDETMGAGFDLSVEAVTVGSLRAGTRQALVVLKCQFPVGGTAAAYLYGIHGGAATLLGEVADANWGPDWGAGPSSIHVRFVNHLLYVEACQTENCSTTGLTTYALRGGKLTKLENRAR